jgi:membrane protein involved in colicin uptake
MSSIQNIQESIKELSVEELLTIIAAATAEAKKKAKIVVKAPKEAKEKKGSMPKGQLPPQLQKPFAWVDYTLKVANEKGWPSYHVKGQAEPMEASVERDGVHVFPSTGKPLNRKQAMSLSKYYWAAKEKVGTNQELYAEFEAQYVAPEPKEIVDVSAEVAAEAAAPKPKKEKAAPKPKKTEEEKEAEKEAKLAAKEAKKTAEKEAKKTAAAAKKAPAAAPSVSPSAAAAASEEVGLEVPKKKAKKPATEAAVDTWVPKTTDGKVYPRTIGGVAYFSNHLHQIWAKDEDGGVGDWAGVFVVSENRIDSTVADPFEE